VLSHYSNAGNQLNGTLEMEIKSAVVQCLVTLGWTPTASSAIASKIYQTAVGEKRADIYLQNWPDSYMLVGDYQSEGRNILDSNCQIIRKTASLEDVAKIARQFCYSVEKTVAESYAVKLLRKGN